MAAGFGGAAAPSADFAASDDLAKDKEEAKSSRGTGEGFGAGRFGAPNDQGAPLRKAPSTTPALPAPKPVAPSATATSAPRGDLAPLNRDFADVPLDTRRRGGRWMKRIFVRRASVVSDGAPVVEASKITAARAAVQASPDERSKHKELARLLALSGQLDELEDVLKRWSERDPMDVDVITGRADLLERRGDRDGAMRVLGGVLAAGTMPAADASVMASAIAQSFERAGDATACAFRIAAAELRPGDAETVARAIVCERGQGRAVAADRWLSGAKDDKARAAIRDAIARVAANRAENTSAGDIVVAATWDGSADTDLDVAILDPGGNRASWASRSRNVRASDVRSRDRETLALSSGMTGSFVVEVVRAAGSTRPVAGKLVVRALGTTSTIPFTLTGTQSQVARIAVRLEEQLVEVDDDIPPPTAPPINRAAIAAALARVSVAHCARSGGPAGEGRVTVTFAPSGRAIAVTPGAPFGSTAVGACVERAFSSVVVPAWDPSQGNVTVAKSFRVPASFAE
jgi:hypothetical protein